MAAKPKNKKGYVGWGEFNAQHWPATHWMPLPSEPNRLKGSDYE